MLTTYEVDNYLGMPGINGFDMGMQFRAHADKLGVAFKEAEVESVEDRGSYKIVKTKEEALETKTVLLASGAEHAKLGVPGEEAFAGKGVSYCATCDGAFFRGKNTAVVGGGDVALEDAIYLSRICRKVYLIHRRDELRGAKILQEELKQIPNITVLYSHAVTKIQGEDAVEALVVKDLKTGEESSLEVSGVFIAVGIHPNTALLENIAARDEAGYILAGEDGVTDRPGIFVAGDTRKKPLRQIVTAVADGANAAISAASYCDRS